jgi:hypothetical protein
MKTARNLAFCLILLNLTVSPKALDPFQDYIDYWDVACDGGFGLSQLSTEWHAACGCVSPQCEADRLDFGASSDAACSAFCSSNYCGVLDSVGYPEGPWSCFCLACK